MLVLLCSLLYARHANVTEYFYDSKYYWKLANVIYEESLDPINILKFPKSIRGYFFPSLTGYFKTFFNGVWGWRVLASLSMAFCFSLSLPYALKGRGLRSLRELGGTLLAYAVYMWLWGDLMQYPLSDFISCILLVSAIAFLRTVREEHPAVLKILFGFCSGALLYTAYNTRPTFLYSGIIILLAFVLINRKKTGMTAAVLISALIGMAVFASPQCYINNRHDGNYSPLVNYDLMDSEVFRGLYTARYETYVGDPAAYPSAGVVFRDPAGDQIIAREQLNIEDFRLTDLFGLFLKYPPDIAGIYVRHLISLLTPVYRQIYLTNVCEIRVVPVITSIFLWLIAGYGILERIRRREITLHSLWILAICLPGLLQIIDEPELRFFLPLYLLCYYDVFVLTDHREMLRSLKTDWPRVLIISALILALWLSLLGDTLSANREHPLLLSGFAV
ncbi:MAG: hypothetical protein IKP86_05610, partial [Anaerolineaceae bacterium]|nr:hypothetical protein [Anaerolineaceae bacterium]